ncbi:MAG: heme NO-binding domain-containing protein [Thiolinea sp.]
MKGVIFTEFLEMVAETFSEDMIDDIIDDSELESGGVYTAVGTYSHEEIVQLVVSLSKHSGIEVSELIRIFGQHLFQRFVVLYPDFFAQKGITAFSFLQSVEDYIHVEVRKLYPDAELPRFNTQQESDDVMLMTYSSAHPFATLAEGLLRGCMDYFGLNAEINTTDLSDGAGTHAEFRIAIVSV